MYSFTKNLVYKDEDRDTSNWFPPSFKKRRYDKIIGSNDEESTTFIMFVVRGIVDRPFALTTQEGIALFIGESDTVTGALAVNAISGLENPGEGQNGEGEGGPMDEATKVWGQVEFQSQRTT